MIWLRWVSSISTRQTMIIDPLLLSPPEKLLWLSGVRKASHINLEAIANQYGAIVKYRQLDGCAARLVSIGEQSVISVGHNPSAGRERFSLGHEIAHLVCDKNTGSFKCSKDDISPRNAEAKSVEAYANNFASQLLLPDYLVNPWMQGKKTTLDVAANLASEFESSRTAAAIKVVKRAASPACLVCHSQRGRVWFQKNTKFPFDFFIAEQLHQETYAFQMAFGQVTGLSRPKKEPANYWLSGKDCFRMMVESQSMKLPDGNVLTLVSCVV